MIHMPDANPTPYVYPGRVLSNYDGDTLQAELDLGLNVFVKVTCRLVGLDAPEMKSSNPLEKEAAKKAKERLATLLNSGPLVFHSTAKPDKYGRLLVKIWIGNICLNDVLIAEGHARPYDGGTKQAF